MKIFPTIAKCVGVLVLAGCGGTSGSTATSEPSISPAQIHPINNPNQVQRPIFSFLPSAVEMVDLNKVYYSAMSACLVANGATPGSGLPAGVAATASAVVADRTERSSLWGFFDVTNVAQYGYERPLGTPGAIAIPVGQGSASITKQCIAKATRTIGGLDPFPDERSLPDGGPKVPTGDSRYTAAVSNWKRCMSGRGFDYNDPISAITLTLANDPATNGYPSAEDIATASADVACKLSTNLVGIADAVQIAYDNQYIETHATQLSDFSAKLSKALQG